MFSGRPARPIGERAATASTLAPIPATPSPRNMGVSTKPGGTLLTVMPLVASSCASDFVNAITPPFEAAYAVIRAEPVWALDDEILIIRPHLAASISGSTA